MGVPRNRRGKIANEYLEVLRRISHQRSVSFQGEFVSFPGTEFYPKPKNMLIWIGGAANKICLRKGCKIRKRMVREWRFPG
ncbi:MAG: LLM class flavin-dependent oxidoreductase [Thaumarchaeota archaeon]|nr:MAG: LLM class flavin-dependent oxidoreductase [Nitrososphaerota archaeon]